MKRVAPREHEIQAEIKTAVELAGFTVYETTAYRQKGPSGVDKGIPDLLVACDLYPHIYLGMEVKRDASKPKWSSPEQEQAARANRFVVVDSAASALGFLEGWITEHYETLDPDAAIHLDKISRVRKGLAGGKQ